MPNKQSQAGNIEAAPNNEWQDVQYGFNGKWIPDVDAALIGPDNFATLQNLRYNDLSVEGISGYTKFNSTPIDTYTSIRSGIQLRVNDDLDTPSYTLVHSTTGAGAGRVSISTDAVGGTGALSATYPLYRAAGAAASVIDDVTTMLEGRFSTAPQGSVAYCNSRESKIFSGREQRISGAFIVTDVYPAASTYKKDRTDKLSKATTNDTITIGNGTAGGDQLLLFTTRPVQGFKFYVSASGGAGHTIAVKYWNGSSFAAVSNAVDGTSGLTATGTYQFDMTTASKPHHFEELYLYAYYIALTGAAATSTIYHVTCDTGFNNMVDVWDGVYRQPITFQKYDGTSWSDFTLFVNEPSTDPTLPIGAEIGGLAAGTPNATGTRIELMFDDPVDALKFTMTAGKVQTNVAAQLTVYYWNGSSFTSVGTDVDGTEVASASMAQTGLVWFPPNAGSVEKTTKFGVTGYLYALEWDAELQGEAASTDADSVVIDLVTGIPAQNTVPAFSWAGMFNNRLVLGNFDEGREGNRMDFSVANAPDVFNGYESSMTGLQSLYFGGDEPITGSVQIYNRFGASVYSMLLVFKDTEVYLLVGDSPEDFIIYPVSTTVGCPAPYTIASAELGMDVAENVSRNIALWLSHAGVMMFDGATLYKIPGIQNFFDPNSSQYIEWATMSRARGWFDSVYKEYNLLIPSTSGVGDNNTWLVYDLLRKKWYTKNTGTAAFPQAAWPCVATTGENFIFAGTNDGYIMRLEDGTSWSGVGIQQIIKTGDFWPSKNIWDETLIRKFRLICKKFPDTTNLHRLDVYYFNNTDTISGIGADWAEVSVASGIAVEFEDTDDVEWASPSTSSIELGLDVGLQRTIRLVQDLNYKGWAHAFQFEVTTDDVEKGFQPIIWGLRYRVERKDDTAT